MSAQPDHHHSRSAATDSVDPAGEAWRSGRCDYCKSEGLPTLQVDAVHTGSGPGYAIRACRTCLPGAGTVASTAVPDS